MEENATIENDFDDWSLRVGIVNDTEENLTDELDEPDDELEPIVVTRPVNSIDLSFEINRNDVIAQRQRTINRNSVGVEQKGIEFERICHRISERVFDYIHDRSIDRETTIYYIRSFLDEIVRNGLIDNYDWYIDYICGSIVLTIRCINKMYAYRQIFDAFI